MNKIIAFSLLSIMLTACATLADSQTVDMTIETPGAENAKCTLENKNQKYIAYTGQTLTIMKSPDDLVVRCMAPGNRNKTVLVKREVNKWVVYNVANGFVLGAAYDYFSRGAFDYPNLVTVDFTSEPVIAYDPPNYESIDMIGGNHKGALEYRGPATPVTEQDRYNTPHILQKKTQSYSDFGSYEPSSGEYQATSRPAVSYDPTEEDK